MKILINIIDKVMDTITKPIIVAMVIVFIIQVIRIFF